MPASAYSAGFMILSIARDPGETISTTSTTSVAR